MIKGLLGLFSSGIIFRLPILIGCIIGIVMMFNLSDEQIFEAFQTPLLYVFGLLISMIYAIFFKRIYHRGGSSVDWRATVYSIFGHFVSYVAAVVFSCLFVYTFSFGGFDNEDETEQLPDNVQVQQIIKQIQKMQY